MTEQLRIVRPSLHNELVQRVRDLVIEGHLKPGQKVPEAELCRTLGVSRTPMREALKVLAAEGLLTLLPNRGAIVAKITAEEIDELFPIMGALEALAGRLACARITDKELAAIRRDHRQMVAHYEHGAWMPYIKLNRAIHEAIFAASGNAALAALYQQLLIRTHSVRFVAKKSEARWREAIEDHERIMAALDRRDGDGLAHVLTEHLEHKAQTMREVMAQNDTAAATSS
jgi:DNA-binding GntR family transcriptional regulator